jgi:hypothetical protein
MHGELHAVGEDLFIVARDERPEYRGVPGRRHPVPARHGNLPPQREAIRTAVRRLGGAFARVILLNSHGHADHVGNNAVLHEIPARETRHFISEQARDLLRSREFFTAAYAEGTRYFNYLEGLDLSPAAVLTQLGRLLHASGLGPVLQRFVPVLLVEALTHADCPSEASEALIRVAMGRLMLCRLTREAPYGVPSPQRQGLRGLARAF